MKRLLSYLDECYVDYPGADEFTFGDMYRLIKQHSTILDRLNPRKMLLMTFYAFDILTKHYSEPEKEKWHILKDTGWMKEPTNIDGHTSGYPVK